MARVRDPLDPKISLWHFLAYALRFEREKHGLSLAQCGEIINAARSTVSNIEAGRLKLGDDQARKLDAVYNTPHLFELLIFFANTSHDPDWFRQYTEFEAKAEITRIYQGQVIPVPLQTDDYARAFLAVAGVKDIDRALAARIARQDAIFERPNPPVLLVLLDEDAIDRPVGGFEVMRAQLQRLLDLGERSNVIIRIVPRKVGAHIGFALVFASSAVLEGLARAGRPALAWVHFAGVGIFIALSSQVILLPIGWPGMWIVSGLVSLSGIAAVAALVPGQPVAAPAARKVGPAAGSAGLFRLALSYGLFGFGYVITATFLVAIVRSEPTLRAFESIAWLAVGLAAAPSVLVWVTVGRRIGLARAYALSCAVEAVGVLLSLWTATAGILLAAILLGGTFVGVTALGLQAARSRAVGDPRRALGVMTTAFSAGQIVGPSFAGFLKDHTGSFTLPTVIAAAALAIAAGLTWRLESRSDRQ